MTIYPHHQRICAGKACLSEHPDRLASLKASRLDKYLAGNHAIFVIDQDRKHPVAVSRNYRLRTVDIRFADLPWMTGKRLKVIHPDFNRCREIVPQPRNLEIGRAHV